MSTFIALGAIFAFAAYLWRSDRHRGKAYGIAFFGALSAIGQVAMHADDEQARSKGFADGAELHAAMAAGIADPNAWRVHMASIAAAKKAADTEAARAMADARAAKAKMDIALASAEAMVRNRLKDPGSADVRTVGTGRDSWGHIVVCGGVNAKNSFGGYTGMKGFVALPETGSVEIGGGGDDTAFNVAWTNGCR